MLQPVHFPNRKTNVPIDQMLENVRINCDRDGVEWLVGQPRPHNRAMVLVGGGPSLHDDLPNIRSRRARGQEIWALNGAHDFLVSKGIPPHALVLLDARAENIQFIRNPRDDVTYYLNAMCHPSLFDALKGKKVVLWFHVMHDKRQEEIVAKALRKNPDRWYGFIEGGSTVGLKSLGLGYALGYRQFHLYGYDSSFVTGPDGKPIIGSQGHAYQQKLNAGDEPVDIHAAGRIYWAAPWMASQVSQMQYWAPFMAELGCKIKIHGRGLLPWVMSQREEVEFLPIEENQRRKWMAHWKDPKNREPVPAETLGRINTFMPIKPGSTVIDYGCGSGALALALANQGASVTGIDFASNALDEAAAAKVTFKPETLWLLPDQPRADYGICRDVLSHIPTHRLDDVLAGMARTATCVYFEEDAKFLPAIRRNFTAANEGPGYIQAVTIDQPNMLAVYDLSTSPPTYDFFSFLLAAENRRQSSRFPMYGGIDLVILQGPDRGFRIDDTLPRDIDTRRMMLLNTVLMGSALCPSVKSVRWMKDKPEVGALDRAFPNDWNAESPSAHYGLRVQVENMHRRASLQAPDWAVKYVADKMNGRPFVTFTIRNARHWRERNSDLDVWKEARRQLVAQGVRVVWVDDVERGGGDFPEAINPCLRMALYEHALDNFGINNGPMWLALTNSKVRACIFRVVQDGNATTNPLYFEHCGLPIGSQPPNPNHRLIWQRETADAIVAAYTERNEHARAA